MTCLRSSPDLSNGVGQAVRHGQPRCSAKRLASHRQGEPRCSAKRLASSRQGEPRCSAKRLASHRQGEPRCSAKRLASPRQGEPRCSAKRLASHRHGQPSCSSKRLASHRQGEPRCSAKRLAPHRDPLVSLSNCFPGQFFLAQFFPDRPASSLSFSWLSLSDCFQRAITAWLPNPMQQRRRLFLCSSNAALLPHCFQEVLSNVNCAWVTTQLHPLTPRRMALPLWS